MATTVFQRKCGSKSGYVFAYQICNSQLNVVAILAHRKRNCTVMPFLPAWQWVVKEQSRYISVSTRYLNGKKRRGTTFSSGRNWARDILLLYSVRLRRQLPVSKCLVIKNHRRNGKRREDEALSWLDACVHFDEAISFISFSMWWGAHWQDVLRM